MVNVSCFAVFDYLLHSTAPAPALLGGLAAGFKLGGTAIRFELGSLEFKAGTASGSKVRFRLLLAPGALQHESCGFLLQTDTLGTNRFAMYPGFLGPPSALQHESCSLLLLANALSV